MNLPIPFDGLYSEANTVSERLNLLILAKLYHIRHENFEEAVRYREAEKSLREQIDLAVKTVGAKLNSVFPCEHLDNTCVGYSPELSDISGKDNAATGGKE